MAKPRPEKKGDYILLDGRAWPVSGKLQEAQAQGALCQARRTHAAVERWDGGAWHLTGRSIHAADACRRASLAKGPEGHRHGGGGAIHRWNEDPRGRKAVPLPEKATARGRAWRDRRNAILTAWYNILNADQALDRARTDAQMRQAQAHKDEAMSTFMSFPSTERRQAMEMRAHTGRPLRDET